MSTTRRRFTFEFKKKVVLEALRERETIESLAKKFELQPSQISLWKAEALSNFDQVFGKQSKQNLPPAVDIEKLYAQIGHQKVEIDFLKKKLL